MDIRSTVALESEKPSSRMPVLEINPERSICKNLDSETKELPTTKLAKNRVSVLISRGVSVKLEDRGTPFAEQVILIASRVYHPQK